MLNLSKSFDLLEIPLLVFLAISFSALPAQAKYGGGTGEPNDPYLIFDANQTNAIGADSNDWDKHFKLMADIDLAGFTGTSFNIIGYYVTRYDNKPFTGVFDGNGHAISNFTYDSNDRDYTGLFGFVRGENTVIKDLGLIDPNVNVGTGDCVGSLVGCLSRQGTITNCYVQSGNVAGNGEVGSLVGYNCSWGTITNSYSEGSVMGTGSYVGGLVGYNSMSTIANCYSAGRVSGTKDVGGLSGYNDGHITNCSSEGDVSGDGGVGGLVGYNGWDSWTTNCYSNCNVSGYWNVGGLVGMNYRCPIFNCYSRGSVAGEYHVGGLVGGNVYGTVSNCYSAGDVWGGEYVGGLVGYNDGSITNCYSAGDVWGGEYVGGLVGYNWGEVSDSFWDIETSRRSNMCGGQDEYYGSGCDDGNGKTTAEMQTESTFTDAGWDFSTPIWKMNCKGMSYPKLSWWQPVLGDFVCPDGVDMRDFAILAAQWRQPPGEPSADIAPNGGDNIVDRFDLAALVNNWLAGL